MCKRGIVSRRDIPRGSVGQIFLMPGSRVAVLTCRSRSEEHTSELQSQSNLVCRLLLEKKKKTENVFSGKGRHEPNMSERSHCIQPLQQVDLYRTLIANRHGMVHLSDRQDGNPVHLHCL